MNTVKRFSQFIQPGNVPSLENLRGIVRAFSALPYENVTKIIRKYDGQNRDIHIRTPEEVMRDFMKMGTGGTCFSLTHCLGVYLENLGYTIDYVLGDMRYAEDMHCALVVTFKEGRYLVDPGYLITEPIALSAESESRIRTSFNKIKLKPRPEKGKYKVFTVDKSGEKWRYTIKDKPVDFSTFKQRWMDSFSFNMMDSILITSSGKDGHLYVRNDYFKRKTPDEKQTRDLKDNYEEHIENIFGIPPTLTQKAVNLLKEHTGEDLDFSLKE